MESTDLQKILLGTDISKKQHNFTKVTLSASVSLEEFREPSFNNLAGLIFKSYILYLTSTLPGLLARWERETLPDNVEEQNLEEALQSEFVSEASTERWKVLLCNMEEFIY